VAIALVDHGGRSDAAAWAAGDHLDAGDEGCMKRGRKPLDRHSATVNMTIRVPATLADAMFVLAFRRQTSVSAITRELYREQTKAITSCNACVSPQDNARLTT
jgi:hypothetical protein